MRNTRIQAYRGDTFTLTIYIKETNILGDTFFLTLKRHRSDEDSAAVASTENTTHTDAATGLSYVTLTAEQTDGLLGTFQADIQWKRADGSIITIFSGTVAFLADVTRRTT